MICERTRASLRLRYAIPAAVARREDAYLAPAKKE
jgi:hypothetical protein